MSQAANSLSVKVLFERIRYEITALHSELLSVETCILKDCTDEESESGKEVQYETLQKMDSILQILLGLDLMLENICVLDESLGEICEDVILQGITLEALALRLSGCVGAENVEAHSNRLNVELF